MRGGVFFLLTGLLSLSGVSVEPQGAAASIAARLTCFGDAAAADEGVLDANARGAISRAIASAFTLRIFGIVLNEAQAAARARLGRVSVGAARRDVDVLHAVERESDAARALPHAEDVRDGRPRRVVGLARRHGQRGSVGTGGRRWKHITQNLLPRGSV